MWSLPKSLLERTILDWWLGGRLSIGWGFYRKRFPDEPGHVNDCGRSVDSLLLKEKPWISFPASLDSRPGTHRVTPERQPPSANMPSEVSPRGSYCLDWGFWLPNA